jgi:hypothetical protein
LQEKLLKKILIDCILKLLLNIALGILALLTIANVFVFVAALGSSHHVPARTLVAFAVSLLGLIAVAVLVLWAIKKFHK